METINVQFDELTKMDSEQHGSGPDLQDTARASSSTSIDKDAPSLSTLPNNETTYSLINSTNVEELHNEEVAELDSDTFKNPFSPPNTSSCYFHAFLSKDEPKNYKEAMIESRWIEAMQEEIHKFERLEVWELVPRPYKAMIISLKWIFKAKLNEYDGALKNKARILKEEVYVSQPEGLKSRSSESCIQIEESTFWFETSSSRMVRPALQIPSSQKFVKCVVDPTLFTGKEGNDLILSKLDEDPNGTLVDPTRYRGLVESLLYLTASHPELVFVVFMCARYQTKPTDKHLIVVKWVFCEFAAFDLLGFWKAKESMFPVLSCMAMDIISVQATSVASEFVFSTSGGVVNPNNKTHSEILRDVYVKDHLDAQKRKQHKFGLETP
nr:hypothetical protein [Tanacetum cinerariifolium]